MSSFNTISFYELARLVGTANSPVAALTISAFTRVFDGYWTRRTGHRNSPNARR